MNLIDSYEKFCKAFNGNSDEIKRAELLLFIQDWIVRIIDKFDEESTDYSLDALVIGNADKSHLRNAKKDAVSRLVDDSYNAVRRISENMRENIIRENVKMPVYKVREVNSYGLNWLSRRPGSTIKEKISSSNASMMAVQRRMSLDTGENRLFVAYLKELADFLQSKLEHFPKSQLRSEEESFYSQIFSILRDPDLEEIRRWENLPPNNTLLSDQNYKKIWRCWNELRQLDELIAQDSEDISHRISMMFYVEFLTKASQYFWFPQIPVTVNYETYTVSMFTKIFFGIDAEGEKLKLQYLSDAIHMEYRGKYITIEFVDVAFQLTIDGKKERVISLNAGRLYKYVELILTKLGCKNTGNNQDNRIMPTVEKYNSIVMDIFAVRPEYIADGNSIALLKGRLINQTHTIETDDERIKFDVACDKANAIVVDENIDTYTVSTAIDDASSFQMGKLMHLLEQYVSAQKFTFLFPDIYNEFQLSLVHKSARLAFHEVRSFPRSIGVAFSYMKTKSFEKTFGMNDFILVMDIVDTDVSFTLVQGLEDESVAGGIPECGGFIWERHPSISYSIEETIKDEVLNSLIKQGCSDPESIYRLLGFNGIKTENKQIASICNSDEVFVISDSVYSSVKAIRINVSNPVNEFLINHKEIIGNSKVHVVSLVPQLLYKGISSFEYLDYEKTLEGYYIYEQLQQRSSITLWRDHLPELAIKLLYGKFNLVDNETITPEFNVEKKICINNLFTLTKDMSEYHFDLVQSDVNRKTRYAAIVKIPFPLNHDVQCRLDMTYQYGAEEPYRLLFIPVEKDAGFVEAKVLWKKVKNYPHMDLPYPSPLPSISWDDLRHFSGKYGEEDLIFGKANLIDTFYQIQSGYQCFDLTGYNPNMQGKAGARIFTADFGAEDGDITVIFNERNQEKQNENGRKVNFNRLEQISCELEEIDLNSTQRYSIDLSVEARHGEVWRGNEYGYSCFRSMTIDGTCWKVAFYANSFVNPSSFNPDIKKITFEVEQYKDNMMRAVRIMDAADDNTYYLANFMRVGNRPGRNVYGSRVFFLLHTVFTGRSTMYDDNCPKALQVAFEAAKDSWVNIYDRCEDIFIKSRIFGQMSLIASDLGDVYYKIAGECIDKYLDGNSDFMIDYLGYGLGDLSNDNEIELFKRMLFLPDELVLYILSKAIWANEDFIKNVELPKILFYFDYAIDYLSDIYKQNKRDTGRKVIACLELLLGIFRLREFQDDDLNRRISLNNPKVQKLYSCIEDIIKLTQDNDLKVRSFLKLEITDNGESVQDNIYKDIPLILYAMLVFITGEKGAGDIKISGLNLDDVDI
jgi:hypothetical protein